MAEPFIFISQLKRGQQLICHTEPDEMMEGSFSSFHYQAEKRRFPLSPPEHQET